MCSWTHEDVRHREVTLDNFIQAPASDLIVLLSSSSFSKGRSDLHTNEPEREDPSNHHKSFISPDVTSDEAASFF